MTDVWKLGTWAPRSRAGLGRGAGTPAFPPGGAGARGTLSSEIRAAGAGPLCQDLPGAGPPYRGVGKASPPRRQPARGPGRARAPLRRSGHPGWATAAATLGSLPGAGGGERGEQSRGGGPAARAPGRVVWTGPQPTPPHRPPYLGGEPDTRPATRPSPRGPGSAPGGACRVGEVAGVTSSTRGRSASGGRDRPSPRAQRLWRREEPHLPRGRWARLLPAPAAQPSAAHPPPAPSLHSPHHQRPPPPPQAGARPQPRPPNQPPDPPSPAPTPVPRDRPLPFPSRTSPTTNSENSASFE
ncbi:proline-rich protein HaeIII subfamily 1-like [Moschus berezovskii]|uniref:proline-rich protein HaeIII subfamily 1-like n=1 Tax=Moschus berezovskii TaxID=68408 RepID=UPI00244482AF|nr:proline-rich protein HaeIII subfamily 1-like [Moschus berezovskii]